MSAVCEIPLSENSDKYIHICVREGRPGVFVRYLTEKYEKVLRVFLTLRCMHPSVGERLSGEK